MDRLHRVEEVAPQVGLSKSGLYEAIRQGQFPAVRIGKRVRVPESALRDWIARQVAAQPTGPARAEAA